MRHQRNPVSQLKRYAEPLERASNLFPTPANRVRWDDLLTLKLLRANERIAEGPVTSDLNLAAFRDELADFDFRTPRPLGELLSWTIEKMEHGLVHVTHPRYFGLFNPAPTFPAQCADRIAGAFNPQLATSTTSPAAVEIEAHVYTLCRAACRIASGSCRPFHIWRIRSKLYGAALCVDLGDS